MPSRKAQPVTEALAARRKELVDYARRRVGPAAEDVVQDASVRALKKAEQLSNPRAARAWLFTIVRRVIAERREPVPVAAAELEPERVVDGCDCIVAQVRALPEAQAKLLMRVVVEGVSVTALADELGITPNNAWVRLHRARQALKAQVADHCGTTSLRQCLDCGCIERGCCQPQS
ncbi:MAG: sigma factor-like helix-turn-helix DNA-binding protein [Myxococcaceae bacterium]